MQARWRLAFHQLLTTSSSAIQQSASSKIQCIDHVSTLWSPSRLIILRNCTNLASDNRRSTTNANTTSDPKEFARTYVNKWRNHIQSKDVRHSPAVVSVGRKESLMQKWIKDCNSLNLDLAECIEFVHLKRNAEGVQRLIEEDNRVGILLAEMLLNEAHITEAEQIARRIISQFTDVDTNNGNKDIDEDTINSTSSNLQHLEALSLIAQIHMHFERKEESKKYCFMLLSNPHMLQSERLVLDVTHVITQQDLPVMESEVEGVLSRFKCILDTYHKTPDVVRMAKKWALPLWERSADFGSNPLSAQQSTSSLPFLHPFILTLAKLEALTSYPFETSMKELRKSLLLGDYNLMAPSSVAAATACAISHQTLFTQGTWEESSEELSTVHQLVSEAEAQLTPKGPTSPLPNIANSLFKLSMYRPLSHLSGFEQIEMWPIEYLSADFKVVVGVQVSEAIIQKRLADNIQDVAPISSQNKHVASFYTTHIFPSWRNVSRESWPSSLKTSMELYYGIPWDGPPDDPAEQKVLIAGCGSGQEIGLFTVSHPDAQVTALDMSKPSLGYAMHQLRRLNIGKKVRFLRGDIEELPELPPGGEQFDLITSMGVLHHLSDPVAGWRKLVRWLKPGGMMTVGLYSRLARRECAAVRGDLAKDLTFDPPMFQLLEKTGTGKLLRQPSSDELREIRSYLLSRPDLRPIHRHSLGELKDLLCHPQERVYTLSEISAILDTLHLKFVGLLLADDPSVREEYKQMFPEE